MQDLSLRYYDTHNFGPRARSDGPTGEIKTDSAVQDPVSDPLWFWNDDRLGFELIRVGRGWGDERWAQILDWHSVSIDVTKKKL